MNLRIREQPGQAESARRDEFTATRWTQILLAANQGGARASREALEHLCSRYWPAIYGYLRRQGKPAADAEDLTQGFFAHLLEENALARARPAKGRFRNFLLGALRRFLVDEGRRSGARKRGRDLVVLALDFAEVEQSYLEETDPGLTAEETYDRRWAATVLETAFADLQAEFHEAGQSPRFEELKRFLSEEGSDADYQAIAKRLGLRPKALSAAVCRLRGRYRELARRTVLATVAGPEEIDPEFRDLFG